MKKGTIELTITLRGEPTAVVHALANGLPVDALEGIRDGMTRELQKRLQAAARFPRAKRSTKVRIRGKAGK